MPPKKLGLVGLLVAFLVALPIFVWSIVNLNFNPKEKALICKERPACLDAVPRPCQIAEPNEGWCPPISPTPSSSGCNLACSILNGHSDCPSGFICQKNVDSSGQDGFCRNVDCPNRTSCVCLPTATPTATSHPTATSTSRATSTPTTPPIGGGEPNSCGGTCGSNFNCQANLFCYAEGGGTQGLCRNPICKTDSNCVCDTSTATPTKTATAKPTKTATTTVTATAKASAKTTSKPTLLPLLTSTPEAINKQPENMFLVKYALPIFGIFALIVISTIFYALKKNKNPNNIPHISPPTNI